MYIFFLANKSYVHSTSKYVIRTVNVSVEEETFVELQK